MRGIAMPGLGLLLTILVLFGVLAIAWWAISQMGLPQPFQIVLVIVVAIIAIYLLMSLVGGGGGLGSLGFHGARGCP